MPRQRRTICRIDPNNERIITLYMDKWSRYGRVNRSPFVELSKIIPHSPRQICHSWWNKLDPRLCLTIHVPFTHREKEYIYEWVEEYLSYNNNKKIPWKTLQSNIEKVFERLRSRNEIKNVWYSRKRRLNRQLKNLTEIFNNPYQVFF
ncbi:unnamed protein product [Rhizophagus irregularis]|nr:unnamed protein product [Rhizophagus irregularis]CAB5355153.1 unnamed protein product [Rhizophagus irregularis]